MDPLQAVFLGIVQGIAEFLPISSSGHLVLLETLLPARGVLSSSEADNLALNVALHVGTLFSIVVVYWKELWRIVRLPQVMFAIIVATLPIVGVGLALHDELEGTFDSPLTAGICLLVTAGLLWWTRRIDQGQTTLESVTWRDALIVGLFQTIAPLPGISRSGVTIVGGLFAGLDRQTAASFSFLIALPAIGGAATLEGLRLFGQGVGGRSLGVMSLGAAVAFVVGVVALRWLLKVIATRGLHVFAWYCAAVGLIAIVTSLLV